MEQEMQSPLQGRKSACDELTTVPIPCSLLQGGGREPKIKQIPGKKECGGAGVQKIWFYFSSTCSDLTGNELYQFQKWSLFCP